MYPPRKEPRTVDFNMSANEAVARELDKVVDGKIGNFACYSGPINVWLKSGQIYVSLHENQIAHESSFNCVKSYATQLYEYIEKQFKSRPPEDSVQEKVEALAYGYDYGECKC